MGNVIRKNTFQLDIQFVGKFDSYLNFALKIEYFFFSFQTFLFSRTLLLLIHNTVFYEKISSRLTIGEAEEIKSYYLEIADSQIKLCRRFI